MLLKSVQIFYCGFVQSLSLSLKISRFGRHILFKNALDILLHREISFRGIQNNLTAQLWMNFDEQIARLFIVRVLHCHILTFFRLAIKLPCYGDII